MRLADPFSKGTVYICRMNLFNLNCIQLWFLKVVHMKTYFPTRSIKRKVIANLRNLVQTANGLLTGTTPRQVGGIRKI